MKHKIEELIKDYEKKIEYFELIDSPNSDFHQINLGILIMCDETIRNLKNLLKDLNSKDASEETPDTL